MIHSLPLFHTSKHLNPASILQHNEHLEIVLSNLIRFFNIFMSEMMLLLHFVGVLEQVCLINDSFDSLHMFFLNDTYAIGKRGLYKDDECQIERNHQSKGKDFIHDLMYSPHLPNHVRHLGHPQQRLAFHQRRHREPC